MATNQHSSNAKTVHLKVMVDKETNKVAYAEASSSFVETLFGLLTLPLATVIKTLRSINPDLCLGSINNLYSCVETLTIDKFKTVACKSMLLHPNTYGDYTGVKVELDGDSREPTTCYICPNLDCFCVSLYEDTKCGRCEREMTTKVRIEDHEVGNVRRRFFEEKAVFVIGEGLRVMQLLPSAILSVVRDQGITGKWDALEEKIIAIEVKELLVSVLYSETPLQDLVMGKKVQPLHVPFTIVHPREELCTIRDRYRVEEFQLKLIMRKSDRKVVYAEVGTKFIVFMFNCLSIPLGGLVNLMGGNSPIESLNTLHSSIMSLGRFRFYRGLLLSPHLKSDNLLLDICEETCPNLYMYKPHGSFLNQSPIVSTLSESTDFLGLTPRDFKFAEIVNPKEVRGTSTFQGRFVKGPSVFMVTDELVVRPLSSTSDVTSILNDLKIPISDLEVVVVKAGKTEALNLLNASLVSDMVFTNVFKPVISSS